MAHVNDTFVNERSHRTCKIQRLLSTTHVNDKRQRLLHPMKGDDITRSDTAPHDMTFKKRKDSRRGTNVTDGMM